MDPVPEFENGYDILVKDDESKYDILYDGNETVLVSKRQEDDVLDDYIEPKRKEIPLPPITMEDRMMAQLLYTAMKTNSLLLEDRL